MKSISQAVFFALLGISSAFAQPSEVGTKLLLAMELKDGETTIGAPKIVVVSGEKASIVVGSKSVSAATGALLQQNYKIDVMPALEANGELLTSYEVTVISPASNGDASNTRTVKMKIKQKPGETVMLQVPATNGEPPMNLTVKTDIVS